MMRHKSRKISATIYAKKTQLQSIPRKIHIKKKKTLKNES